MRPRIRRAEATCQRGIKAEASIVFRVTQNKHGLPAGRSDAIEGRADELAADARTLPIWTHGQWRKAQRRKWRIHPGQQNVPDDDVVIDRNQRKHHTPIFAQTIHQVCLVPPPEGGLDQRMGGRPVRSFFMPHDHGLLQYNLVVELSDFLGPVGQLNAHVRSCGPH